MKRAIGIIILTIAIGFLSIPSIVQAETTTASGCTAISTAGTISNSGLYCLTADITVSSGNGIIISTDDVVLDLNAHTISGSGTASNGITAYQKSNITIRNGTITGFVAGIALMTDSGTPTSGNLIEEMNLIDNKITSISLSGEGSIVRNSRVIGTTNSGTSTVQGIVLTHADGGSILNNDISGTAAQGTKNSYAINTSNSENLKIKDNRITDTSADTGNVYTLTLGANTDYSLVEHNFVRGVTGSGGRAGIISVDTNSDFIDNRVSGAATCYVFNSTTNRYRDNIASNCTTAYSGGTDLGNND